MKTILNTVHLALMTIRKLKVIASGKGITKARYGKCWHDMNKAELISAISDYYRVVNSAPKTRNWRTVRDSARITTVRAEGIVWTACVGFESQQAAYKFFYWVLSQCSWAITRKGECTGSAYEVKTWGIAQELLDNLIERDTPKVRPLALDDRSSWQIAGKPRGTVFCGKSID